ncbi:MAG: hypothetical protein KY439_05080 [Actinobacteria bacterium]|nr:hypothetical protein [Actinomycetota bacterium]
MPPRRIGDVLPARGTRADAAHLGDLASVACFLDDGQISEIHTAGSGRVRSGTSWVLSEL